MVWTKRYSPGELFDWRSSLWCLACTIDRTFGVVHPGQFTWHECGHRVSLNSRFVRQGTWRGKNHADSSKHRMCYWLLPPKDSGLRARYITHWNIAERVPNMCQTSYVSAEYRTISLCVYALQNSAVGLKKYRTWVTNSDSDKPLERILLLGDVQLHQNNTNLSGYALGSTLW